MGTHLNYHRIIRTILVLNNRINSKDFPKSKTLIDYLKTIQYDVIKDDWDELPTNKDIAKKLNTTSTKANAMLREIYYYIIDNLHDEPLEIENVTYSIAIYYPYDETEGFINRDYANEVHKKSLAIKATLKECPRIGETVDLDFIDENKFNRGYVHDLVHTINGKTQEIVIHIHPFHSEYYRWMKLKSDYDYWANR